MALVKPTGARMTGNDTSAPSTVVESEGVTGAPGTAIFGTKPTASNASRFARMVRSVSAAPSM